MIGVFITEITYKERVWASYLIDEDIMREVQPDDRCSMYDGVKINGREIVDLRYADDTSLLSESASGLSSLVESVKDHSE